jgi:hypothetical protein
MNQSSSWQTNSHSASQEISCFYGPKKVHYRLHISPPLVPILSQMRLVHIFPSCFPKIHSGITSHLRPRLPSGLFPSWFPTKILYALLISPMRTTCPAHLILVNFWWRVQFTKIVIMQSSPETVVEVKTKDCEMNATCVLISKLRGHLISVLQIKLLNAHQEEVQLCMAVCLKVTQYDLFNWTNLSLLRNYFKNSTKIMSEIFHFS